MRSIGNSLAGAPSAVSCEPDRLDVFAVVAESTGNKIGHWRLDGETWTAGILPPGPPIPAEGLCAVSSAPKVIDVFAASGAGNTPWWWQWNGTTWLPRGPLPPGANLHPVAVAAVCSRPDNIDVFAAGFGNTPHWWHWNGSSWSAPVPLPGSADLRPVRVAVVSARPNRLDVFAAGAGNQLWHWWRDEAVSPAWNVASRGGNLPEEGVSAVSWGTDRIDVFAASRGAGHHNPLQHWWWDGGQFNGPENLDGNLAPGTVSAVSVAPNRLDVFGVSGDGRLARWQWDGDRWSGPRCMGDRLPAGDVAAVALAPHRVAVFARGPGNSLLQWPGGGLQNATSHPWTNLAMNWQVPSVPNSSPIAPATPLGPLAGHCYPDSLEELVDIVKAAERLGRRARAVGSSWSNSDVAVTPDYLVETHKLNGEVAGVLAASAGVLAVPRGNLVHVEAGITLGDLVILLDKRGLALPTLGGSSGQTLAGAVSTSVHGADFKLGPLPDVVRAIHLVGPGGVQHWIEPRSPITDRFALSKALGLADANIHQDDDWFNSALVSVGSFGIIYSLVIEAVPQFDLVERREWLTWTDARARLAQGAADSPFADALGNDAVTVIVNPFRVSDDTRPCVLITRKRAPATMPGSPAGGIDALLLKFINPRLILDFELNPALIDDVVTWQTRELLPATPAGQERRGLAYTIAAAPGTPPLRGLSLEMAFDASNDAYLGFVDEACDILHASYRDERLGLAGWFSLRYVGRSRAYLSPQHRFARTCMVEIAGLQELSHTRKLLARLEAAGRRHSGIQHWGMFDDLRAADVARAYPRLDTWRQVRHQLTGNGTLRTFDNAFTERCGLSAAVKAPGGGWDQLAPNPIAAGPGACSRELSRLDVFVRGTDNALYIKSWDGSQWSDYAQLGPNEVTSDPAAVSWVSDRIDVVVRGTDNALYAKSWDGSQWSDYQDLGGDFTSGPAVCSWAPGRLDVFARGTDNALWHAWFEGAWSTWEQLGTEPISSDPAAVSWGPDRIDVFVRGTDNALYTKSWDGSRWTDYLSLGGAFTSGPAACSWGPGRLDVFARGTDDALWHLWHENGWSTWEQLGAEHITSDPDAVAWGPNRIDVFARGTDSALYHKWWDGNWGP